MENPSYGWSTALIVLAIRTCQGFIKCSGNVIVKPSAVVPVGTNVSIMCISSVKDCQGAGTISICLNYKCIKPDWMNRTMAGIQLYDIRTAYFIYCSIDCSGVNHAICWKDLEVGFSPESATNLTCSYEENSSIMTCTWDKGRASNIRTEYAAHFKNLQTKECHWVNIPPEYYNVTIPVNRSRDKLFELFIKAKNDLGESVSDVLQILLDDIVVPADPVIKVEDLNLHFKILVNWRNQTFTHLHFCQLAYKSGKSLWTLVTKQAMNKKNALLLSAHLEAQAVKVRCKDEGGQGSWSRWSEPTEFPQKGSQMAPDVHCRNVSGYKIYFKNKRKGKQMIKVCERSQIQCSVLVPKEIIDIFIVAYNTYGESPPRLVTILQDQQGQIDFPAAQNVTVISGQNLPIQVQWNLPKTSATPLHWFLLHLVHPCDGKQKDSWQALPKEQTYFEIEDTTEAGSQVNISLYAVYNSSLSKPCLAYGFSEESEPKAGPNEIEEKAYGEHTIIQWQEISLCERRGFITGYTVHLSEEPNGNTTKYKSTSREFIFRNIKPNTLYKMCLTASTRAGEGPCGKHILLRKDTHLQSYVELLLIIGFGSIVLSFILILMFKKTIRIRIKLFVEYLTPEFLHEACPHLKNSTALQGAMQFPDVYSNNLYFDPEYVSVEELLPHEMNTTAEYGSVVNGNENTALEILIQNSDVYKSKESEQILGYVPQSAKTNVSRRDSYCSPSHMMNIQLAALSSESALGCTSQRHSSKSTTNMLHFQDDFLMDSNIVLHEILPSQVIPKNSSNISMDTHLSGAVTGLFPFCLDKTVSCYTTTEDGFTVTKTYFPQVFAQGI
ncbi:hypothetical protein GDO86_008004 [Hymenochirus boettgeri]|uniref:Fibronectin type-III domain-containing protein n=1 Tax=Hymenochirus boettgeri TaxID=247094 RepID=A0A8T2IVX6_9PIPI|nr:hypothetical protein GDO86_008004 [Hymenochirus boettgeri]